MKQKFLYLIRVMAVMAAVVLCIQGVGWLLGMHRSAVPQADSLDAAAAAFTIGLVLLILLLPVGVALIGLCRGYKLHRLHVLFIEVTHKEKLHIRLTGHLGFRVHMLPPRTDGTSPSTLYLLSVHLYFLGAVLLMALLTLVTWQTAMARGFMVLGFGFSMGVAVMLLPQKNTDALSRVLKFRRSHDLQRAWECAVSITAAMADGKRLDDMPEEWFLPYPAELMNDAAVQVCTFNRSSWLICHDRELEGYEALRPLFDLVPRPETHQTIAGALLNGAVCEALNDLPPMCLSQLDHPSLKYMTPARWERAVLTAKYARALLLHQDPEEAAAILPALEKLVTEENRGRETLARLQAKAGIGEGGEAACSASPMADGGQL